MVSARSGFTLIELIITIVVISLGAGVIYSYLEAISRSPEPAVREKGIVLGRALMEEVAGKRWDEATRIGGSVVCTAETSSNCTGSAGSIGADPGENRAKYDDVDDYNGLTENGIFQDQEGNTETLSGFSRSVSVCYIPSSAVSISASTPACASSTTDTKRIVVTVGTPAGENFSFVAVRCNY